MLVVGRGHPDQGHGAKNEAHLTSPIYPGVTVTGRGQENFQRG